MVSDFRRRVGAARDFPAAEVLRADGEGEGFGGRRGRGRGGVEGEVVGHLLGVVEFVGDGFGFGFWL